MKYRANKVADLLARIKKGTKYVEIPNLLGFSVPDVTFGESELNGAGMIGPVKIPDPSNIEAMESSITTSDDAGYSALLNDPDGVELVLHWAVDKVGTNGSSALCRNRHSADYTEVETMPKLFIKPNRHKHLCMKFSA